MGTDGLIPHPASAPSAVASVTARVVSLDTNWLTLRWRIEGSGKIVVPPLAGKGRADGLWQTTCFELFVLPEGGEAYSEFNLSASEQWAAYDFSAYREGMRERPVPRDPVCTWRAGSAFSLFDAALPASALPQLPARIALTAVLEEEGGTKSYWAAAHPSGKPDFHDPACFTGTLAAPR